MEVNQPLSGGFTAQFDALAQLLRLSMLDYWDCCDDIDRENMMARESCYTPYVRRIGITLLSAALCEATINTYLSLRLPSDDWRQIERRASTVAKWSTVIEDRLPGYKLDVDSGLGAELKSLFEIRDAIVHAKPEVREGEIQRLEGNAEKWTRISHESINDFYSLTPRLFEPLATIDWRGAGMLISSLRLALNLPEREVHRRFRKILAKEISEGGPPSQSMVDVERRRS